MRLLFRALGVSASLLLGGASLSFAQESEATYLVRDVAPKAADVAASMKQYIDVATNRPLYVPGVIIIKLKTGVRHPAEVGFLNEGSNPRFEISSLQEKFISAGATGLEQMFPERPIDPRVRQKRIETGAEALWKDLELAYKVFLPAEADVVEIAKDFAKDPNIEYAEPEPIMYLMGMDPYCAEEWSAAGSGEEAELLNLPNDPEFGRLFYMQQVGAPLAWGVHRSENGAEVVIGITDSGTRWYHPDLIDNIKQNLGEDANNNGRVIEFVNGQWQFDPGDINGIDDDGDGYADNFIGWNFASGSGMNTFDRNNPDDVNGHGTHVAGSASARTNNGIGVAAIAWNAKLVNTAHGNSSSSTAGLVDPYRGIEYCARVGVDIINCSWGGGGSSNFGRQVIEAAHRQGIVIVAAAGNENVSTPSFPASISGVVNVAAVNGSDRKTAYSNYGSTITISAPGGVGGGATGIYSTWINPPYIATQGTSMASPIVASAFALLKSFRPDWTREQLIDQILSTADDISRFNIGAPGITRRLNIGRAMTEIGTDIFNFIIEDENSNRKYDPDETLTIKSITLDLRGVAGNPKGFRLRSEDPTITILDSVHSGSYPSEITTITPDFRLRLSSEAGLARIITLDIVVMEGENEVSSGKFDLLAGEGGVVLHERGRATSSLELLWEALPADRPDLHYVRSYNRLLNYEGASAVFITNSVKAPAVFLEADLSRLEEYLATGGKVYMDGLYDLPNMDEEMRSRFFEVFGMRDIRTGIDEELYNRRISGSSGAFIDPNFSFTSGSSVPIPPEFKYSLLQSLGNRVSMRQEVVGIIGIQTENSETETKTIFISPYSISDFQDSPNSRAEFAAKALEYFGLKPISVAEEQNTFSQVKVFPNPTQNGNAIVSFFDAKGGEYQVRIFDYVGREVGVASDVTVMGGTTAQTAVNMSHLPAGTYYIRIFSKGTPLHTLPVVNMR